VIHTASEGFYAIKVGKQLCVWLMFIMFMNLVMVLQAVNKAGDSQTKFVAPDYECVTAVARVVCGHKVRALPGNQEFAFMRICDIVE
jgi:hypothetical protein